jgi:hypothetical protein
MKDFGWPWAEIGGRATSLWAHCPPQIYHDPPKQTQSNINHWIGDVFSLDGLQVKHMDWRAHISIMHNNSVAPPVHTHCWWSLTSIINHQHNLHIYLIPPPNIDIGVWTNEFHELWWIFVCRRIYLENSLRTTIMHSKQANRWQHMIQPVKTTKDNSWRF